MKTINYLTNHQYSVVGFLLPKFRRKWRITMAKTNADRIREMSIEELAVIIMCPHDVDPDCCVESKGCVECCKKWLESEAEE